MICLLESGSMNTESVTRMRDSGEDVEEHRRYGHSYLISSLHELRKQRLFAAIIFYFIYILHLH